MAAPTTSLLTPTSSLRPFPSTPCHAHTRPHCSHATARPIIRSSTRSAGNPLLHRSSLFQPASQPHGLRRQHDHSLHCHQQPFHLSLATRCHSHRQTTVYAAKRTPRRTKYAGSRQGGDDVFVMQVEPSGADAGRKLHDVADMIADGAVGIVPTDTVYAIVCDLTNRDAVDKMYRIKDMDPKKPLSILCRSFQDIDQYTLGFPRGNSHGQTNIFRAARQCLPGPYTFILKASKEMPKQCTTFGGSAVAHCAPRKSVGVRMPADPICQALLQLLARPLLCTSATVSQRDDWLVDPAVVGQTFRSADGSEGVDFIVDGGARAAEPSTVVDMTGSKPAVLRPGKGPVEDWMVMEVHDSSELVAAAFLQGKINPYASVSASA